jgi:nitric oxide reductase subunit B
MTGTIRTNPLSPWWRNITILVMIFGFATLSVMTFQTYKHAPPIPERVQDEAGPVLFTGEDITGGQGVFFKYGLMEHGSIWGHGAYLGPDYSARYLHREAEIVRDRLSMDRYGKRSAELPTDGKSAISGATQEILKANRHDGATRVLIFSRGETESYRIQQREWADYFAKKDAAPGLDAGSIKSTDEQRKLTAFFAWASWASRANRPGKDYSYTNNFPYEPLAGNTPTTAAYTWSALSLVFLLGGLGLILFLFGKFDFLGWKGEGEAAHVHQSPLIRDGLDGRPTQRSESAGAPRDQGVDPHAEPVGYGALLRRGGSAAAGPGARRRRDGPLPGGKRCLLRHRPRPLLPLQSTPHLAPPARHLLDRHRLHRRRAVPCPRGGGE